MYVRVYEHIYACSCVCMHTCMYVCTYVCVSQISGRTSLFPFTPSGGVDEERGGTREGREVGGAGGGVYESESGVRAVTGGRREIHSYKDPAPTPGAYCENIYIYIYI